MSGLFPCNHPASGRNPALKTPSSLRWRVLTAVRGVALLFVGTACSNFNSRLPLPKVGGPIPVSAPHEQTPAERAYWDQLALARIIYIGETHTSNADHEYQFEVLRGLKARGVAYTIAWEMFDSPQQPLLDAWQLRRVSTDSLLDKTDFQRHWGTFSVMYEKILRWSQAEGIPSLALNAPPALGHKLAQGQPLDPAEQQMLPTDFRPLPGGYEHFTEQMGQNPHPGASLENYYKAQLLWDQTMATRIVDYINAHPERKVIVLLGRGHIDGGYGVPAFVSQKTDAPQLLVYPGDVPDEVHGGGRLALNMRAARILPL